jgi:glycosyltransferase involved in cell wall biosynthesis
MRILVHHRIASRDGQAVHLEELSAAMMRLGHTVLLVGPASFSQTEFGASSRLVDKIKQILPGAVYELLEIVYNIKAYFRLRAAVRAFRPDIIYERFSLFLFAGIWVKRRTGLKLLLEVNSPLFEERAKNDGLKLKAMGRWAQRWLWRSADHVLPVTKVLGGMVASNGVPWSRISVIPNGINPERFQAQLPAPEAKAALGLPPSRLVLGFTGFIRGWNAVHRLIDFVAAQALDLHILVVGDGPAREPLLQYARDKNIADRLTIVGVVERDQIARHICAFDVALLPAVTPYSSPLKLFEYLYLGRAIVAPNDANIREILTDGRNALLFDTGKAGGMEEALLTLCRDQNLRQLLGTAAREAIAEQSLTWDNNAERVVDLAKAAIAGASIR